MSNPFTEVAIIGAGPYGLSIAARAIRDSVPAAGYRHVASVLRR
jgi:hypothetical protein